MKIPTNATTTIALIKVDKSYAVQECYPESTHNPNSGQAQLMIESETKAGNKKNIFAVGKLLPVICLFFIAHCLLPIATTAQVNAVEFGKSRVQYKKFKWQYYQTPNFNIYFNEGGQELAKFVAQSAEKELPQIETAAEYSLQRRANIVVYNSYADMQQSNIGLGIDWQNTSGTTKLS